MEDHDNREGRFMWLCVRCGHSYCGRMRVCENCGADVMVAVSRAEMEDGSGCGGDDEEMVRLKGQCQECIKWEWVVDDWGECVVTNVIVNGERECCDEKDLR